MDKYKVEDSEREAYRGRSNPLEWRRVRRSKNLGCENGEKREYNLQRLQSMQEESNGRRRDEAAANDGYYEGYDEEDQIKRMDAEIQWLVDELLAADCEKAWIHARWEDTMQKWYMWLEKMKKEDEKKKMEDMHQQKVTQMIKIAEGSAGLLHKSTGPTAWRGGAQILKQRRRCKGVGPL